MPATVKGNKTRQPTEQELKNCSKTEHLICVDSGENNNNKFWRGYALANGDGYCEWGRVGKSSQHEYYEFGDTYEAERWLERKSHEKQNKGGGKASYTPLRTISGSIATATSSSGGTVAKHELKTIATQQIKGDSEVKKLVAWLAEVNIHQIVKNTQITYNVATGAFSTPLGLVTPDGIDEARNILNDLSDYVVKRDWENNKYKGLLNNYLRIIPQDVGMKRGWHSTLFAGSDALVKQNDILDSLAASLQSTPADKKDGKKIEQVFEAQLETISDQNTINRIKHKYESEKGSHYDVRNFRVAKCWNVHIPSVRKAFDSYGRKLSNIKELWHGLKCSSLLSVLKSGLIIMPTSSPNITGSCFGRGIYTSNQSSKSIRYATDAWTSGGNIHRTFMLLCEVSLGKYYTPYGTQSGSFKPPSGYDSCWAKRGKSGIQNDEIIVYRTDQMDIKFLVEFSK